MAGAAHRAKVWNERYIRRALDGTFTRFLPDGGVKVEKVKLDYHPDHKPPYGATEPSPYIPRKIEKRVPFSDADDDTIIRLMKAGKSRRQIAFVLDRAYETVRYREALLRRIGRL